MFIFEYKLIGIIQKSLINKILVHRIVFFFLLLKWDFISLLGLKSEYVFCFRSLNLKKYNLKNWQPCLIKEKTKTYKLSKKY